MKLEQLIPGKVKVSLVPRKEANLAVQISHVVNQVALQRSIRLFIDALGIDHTTENFKETPRRVARLWSEWLKPKEISIKVFTHPGDGMVILRNHRTMSVCPHHLLPIEYRANVAYLPSEHAVGLSKLPRLVNFAAGSFMLQEHVSEFVVELLNMLLLPKAVACMTIGTHGCMRYRGIMTEGDTAYTALRGIFVTDEKARMEFYEAIKNGHI